MFFFFFFLTMAVVSDNRDYCAFNKKGSHIPKETEEHQFGFHVRDRIIFTLLNLSLQKLIFLLLQLSVILRSSFKQHVTFIYDS